MGIYINGLYINQEQRFKDGKPDGFNLLCTVGTDAYKVKVPDDVHVQSGAAGLKLGDQVSIKVRASAFRDTIYFTAETLELIDHD